MKHKDKDNEIGGTQVLSSIGEMRGQRLRGEYVILPVDSARKVTALGRRVPPIAGLVPLNPGHFAHIVNGLELIRNISQLSTH